MKEKKPYLTTFDLSTSELEHSIIFSTTDISNYNIYTMFPYAQAMNLICLAVMARLDDTGDIKLKWMLLTHSYQRKTLVEVRAISEFEELCIILPMSTKATEANKLRAVDMGYVDLYQGFGKRWSMSKRI